MSAHPVFYHTFPFLAVALAAALVSPAVHGGEPPTLYPSGTTPYAPPAESANPAQADAAAWRAVPKRRAPRVVNPLDKQLYDAVVGKDAARVKQLLEAGASPRASSGGFAYMPALDVAINTNQIEVVKLFLARMDADEKSFAGLLIVAVVGTDYYRATVTGTLLSTYRQPQKQAWKREITGLLIAKGAKITAADTQGNTVLHYALGDHGDFEAVKCFLSKGANLNVRNTKGETPLHWSGPWSAEQTEFLLAQGADLHALDEQGREPVHQAVAHGNLAVAQTLIKHGAKLADSPAPIVPGKLGNISSQETLLHVAAAAGRPEMFPYLLSLGIKIDAPDRSGQTPLMYAAATMAQQNGATPPEARVERRRRCVETMDALLAKGASIDATSDDVTAASALHLAASAGDVELGRYLITHGAKVDLPCVFRVTWNTPAQAAGDVNAPPTRPGQLAGTPLEIAIRMNRLDFCKFLVGQGSDLKRHGRRLLNLAPNMEMSAWLSKQDLGDN